MNSIFLSICIPAYNRPLELRRLLDSIDSIDPQIEIIICEDRSPKRSMIAQEVSKFKEDSGLSLAYFENAENLGYDANLRELIGKASGEYLLFMGDDDFFVPGSIDAYMVYLRENSDLGYVLKSHELVHANGNTEAFRYYPTNRKFEPGVDACKELFRKSVFISGFTIKRQCAQDFATDRFDGTLLYQLYILAETVMRERSGYCSLLLTRQFEGGTPYFGSAESEKNLYKPGEITVQNSINFIQGFFTITDYLDAAHGTDLSDYLRTDFSKYSYPIISIQKSKTFKEFSGYVKSLRSIGIDKTWHFNFYYVALLLLGKRVCDAGIFLIKSVLGRTPRL